MQTRINCPTAVMVGYTYRVAVCSIFEACWMVVSSLVLKGTLWIRKLIQRRYILNLFARACGIGLGSNRYSTASNQYWKPAGARCRGSAGCLQTCWLCVEDATLYLCQITKHSPNSSRLRLEQLPSDAEIPLSSSLHMPAFVACPPCNGEARNQIPICRPDAHRIPCGLYTEQERRGLPS